MPKVLSVKPIATGLALIFLGMLISALIEVTAGPGIIEKIAFVAAANARPSTASEFVSCTPVEVAVFVKSRIHVRCEEHYRDTIEYFALPTTDDAAEAARILSILTSAQVTGKTLNIFSDLDDLSGDSFGCQRQDCRVIQGVALEK